MIQDLSDECHLTVDDSVTGPSHVQENSWAGFNIGTAGESNITYKWTCIPQDAGGFDNEFSSSPNFLASEVTEDLQAQIKVTIDAGACEPPDTPVLRFKNITIENEILPNQSPVAVASAITVTIINTGEIVHFDGSGSYDPDGSITQWLWDFDDDGIYGDSHSGDQDKPVATFYDAGSFFVGLKVIDNMDIHGILDQKILVEVNELSNLEIVKTVPTLGQVRDVFVVDGYAYMTDSSAGLLIMDIHPPETAGIDKIVPMNSAYNVAVSGMYASVADSSPGIQIVEITPPETAHIINAVATSGFAENTVAVSGGYTYVSDGINGFQIIDTFPPETASIIKPLNTPGQAEGISISGDYAYIADGNVGIQIFDISPAIAAFNVRTVDIPLGYAKDVAVSEGYAYVADMELGLRIVDIYPQNSAHLENQVPIPGVAWDIDIAEGYAYLADKSPDGGLYVIDVDPPGTASLVDTVYLSGGAWAVAVSDGYAYVARQDSGLTIFELY